METIDGFDEQRIDTIGPNGNEGLHYEEKEVKDSLTIILKEVNTLEQLRELVQIVFTALNGHRDIVTEITAETEYFNTYPNLKAIAKADHGENTTA